MKIVFPTVIQLPSKQATCQYTMWMCEALSQHADVVLYVEKISTPLSEIFEYYDVRPSFEIRELRRLWKPRSFWGARRLARGFPNDKPSLVYLSDVRLLRFLLSFAPKWNYIYDAENLPSDLKPYVGYVNSTAAVICHNQQFQQDLVEIGVDPRKILVCQNGVNLQNYRSSLNRDALRQELGIPTAKKIVMYTGHFYEWKGVEILLRAASRLDAETEVYLVGGKENDIQRIVESCKGLSWTNVKMVPFQPPGLIPKFQRAADVLVLPNISASEDSSYYTSPLKLFQYMAAGRPIVASDLPSIRTILNSDNAYLVSPDDPQALAGGIRDALSNHQESARRAEQAQEDVKQCTWEKRADSILDFVAEKKPKPKESLASEALSF